MQWDEDVHKEETMYLMMIQYEKLWMYLDEMAIDNWRLVKVTNSTASFERGYRIHCSYCFVPSLLCDEELLRKSEVEQWTKIGVFKHLTVFYAEEENKAPLMNREAVWEYVKDCWLGKMDFVFAIACVVWSISQVVLNLTFITYLSLRPAFFALSILWTFLFFNYAKVACNIATIYRHKEMIRHQSHEEAMNTMPMKGVVWLAIFFSIVIYTL